MDLPVSVAVLEHTNYPAVRFQMEWIIENYEICCRSEYGSIFSAGITMAELGIRNRNGRFRISIGPFCDSGSANVNLCLTDCCVNSRSYTDADNDFYMDFKFRMASGNSPGCTIEESQELIQWPITVKKEKVFAFIPSYDRLFSSDEEKKVEEKKVDEKKDDSLTIFVDAVLYYKHSDSLSCNLRTA